MHGWKGILGAALMTVSGVASAVPVYMDSMGREWLDVNDSRNRSWIDVVAVCGSATGVCSGVLATTTPFSTDLDLGGYMWATRDEVRDLFYEVGGLPPGALDGYVGNYPRENGFGVGAFGLFEPTIELPTGPGVLQILNGLTRDLLLDSDGQLRAYTGLITHDTMSPADDTFNLAGSFPINSREISMGVYLYRPVPEPDTLVLFVLGLAGLVLIRRRRAH